MNHNFNEKTMEYSTKQKKKISVFQSEKYQQSKAKAIEIIEKYDDVDDADFWILMNETKSGQMMYSGLIISHNGCLKINDHLESKFVPSCVTLDKDGYKGSLVYTYCNDEQGIYEVGEVSSDNCKNSYPYAMAYKRLFDRVVLKLSKLAYSGVYSDSEADEFRRPDMDEATEAVKSAKKDGTALITRVQLEGLKSKCKEAGVSEESICDYIGVKDLAQLTYTKYAVLAADWSRIVDDILMR